MTTDAPAIEQVPAVEEAPSAAEDLTPETVTEPATTVDEVQEASATEGTPADQEMAKPPGLTPKASPRPKPPRRKSRWLR